MRANKIRGRLAEMGCTYADAAKALDISTVSFCNKINGKSRFFAGELEMLGDFLGYTPTERGEIFLTSDIPSKND